MKNRLLSYLLVGIGVFNINDYILTKHVLQTGYDEANPILKMVVSGSAFAVIKIVIIPAALIMMWYLRYRTGRVVFAGVCVAFIEYAMLMVYFLSILI